MRFERATPSARRRLSLGFSREVKARSSWGLAAASAFGTDRRGSAFGAVAFDGRDVDGGTSPQKATFPMFDKQDGSLSLLREDLDDLANAFDVLEGELVTTTDTAREARQRFDDALLGALRLLRGLMRAEREASPELAEAAE